MEKLMKIPARYVGEGGHGDQPRLVVLQDCPVEPDCALAIRIDKMLVLLDPIDLRTTNIG